MTTVAFSYSSFILRVRGPKKMRPITSFPPPYTGGLRDVLNSITYAGQNSGYSGLSQIICVLQCTMYIIRTRRQYGGIIYAPASRLIRLDFRASRFPLVRTSVISLRPVGPARAGSSGHRAEGIIYAISPHAVVSARRRSGTRFPPPHQREHVAHDRPTYRRHTVLSSHACYTYTSHVYTRPIINPS